jgi:hypothetical protein
MNKQQFRNELEETLNSLYDLFASIPDDAVNTAPFTGSWTPSQLAHHVVLTNSGFLRILNGPVQHTDRPANAGVESLRTVLLDRAAKRQAPEMVQPAAIDYDKVRLLASFQKTRAALLEAVDTLDPNLLCTSYKVPVLGHPTCWEALHFVLYHTQRHLHQLQEMMEAAKQ